VMRRPWRGLRRSYYAGQKIKGKKRHTLVDTLGLSLHAVVHPTDIQDRDGEFWSWQRFLGCFHC
jgi:hypothetical protein